MEFQQFSTQVTEVVFSTVTVIWQNTFFHYITALFLVIAMGIEIWSVWQYHQELKRPLKSVFRHLESNCQSPISSEGKIWLEHHLKRNLEGVYERQGELYILHHYPGILSRATPRSPMRFMPTILTAVGVLGTFYGIQTGLADINPNPADSNELLQSSQTLFAGMKTAFSTSLMGLLSSSLFTLVLALTEFSRQKRRKSLKRRLEALTILETAEISIANLSSKVESLKPEIFGHQIGKQVGEQIGMHFNQAITSQLVPVFQEINSSLQILREIKADQGQEILRSLIQSLRTDVLEPVADRLDQSALLTRQTSEAVQSLQQELGSVTCSLVHFNQAITSQLVPVFQEINSSLQVLREIKADQGQEILRSLIQSLRTDVLEPVADRLDQSALLTRQTSEAVQSLQQELGSVTCSLGESVHTIQSFQQDTLGKLHEFADDLQQVLHHVQTETRSALQTTAEAIKLGTVEILEQSKSTFAQQSQTLQTLGDETSQLIDQSRVQLVQSLQSVEKMLNQSSQQVDNSMKTIKETAEAVSKLALADHLSWGAKLGELQEASRGVGQALQQLEKTNRQVQASYQQINQQTQTSYQNALSTWNSEIKTHLKQLTEAQEKFFADADSSMALVSSKFLETATVLVEIERQRGGDHGQN